MILFNAPKYAMLAKHYSKSQQVTWSYIIIILIYLYLLPDFVDSFEKQNDNLTKNFGLINGEQNISTPTENAQRSKEKLVDKMSSIEQNRNMDIQNIYKDMKQK